MNTPKPHIKIYHRIIVLCCFLGGLPLLGHTATGREDFDHNGNGYTAAVHTAPEPEQAQFVPPAEDFWAAFKTAPVTFLDGTTHTLDDDAAAAIQAYVAELNETFNFLDATDDKADFTIDDQQRTAGRLKYWLLYHTHKIETLCTPDDGEPSPDFLTTFFAGKMAPPKGNPSKNADFLTLPDPHDPHLIFTYLIDTLHHATGGWVRIDDFFTLVDVIGAMLSRADYNLGEVRVLAYWLHDTLTTLSPTAPEKGRAPAVFTFDDPAADLFADEDQVHLGANALFSPHTPEVENDIFEAAKKFYRGPTPWRTQQQVMQVLHRIAFAITTPNFKDAQLAETLTTAPLNAVPSLTLPGTIRTYGPFLEHVLTHFSQGGDAPDNAAE